MPEFTIEDVDRRIEEIRARHKPKPQGNSMLEKLRDIARRRRGLKPPTQGVR